MKKDDFHIPFIKNLAFIGLVTIVSMISVHYLLHNMLMTPLNTPDYTSQKFYISTESSK